MSFLLLSLSILNTANIRTESKQFRRFTSHEGVNYSCLFGTWSLGGNLRLRISTEWLHAFFF